MTHRLPAILEAAARAARDARHAEACRLYGAGLASAPGNLDAEIGLARALFCLEDWRAAWAAFDVRFRLMASPPKATRAGPSGTPVEVQRWRSGPVPKRLLVLDEQGMGDTLQFSRFLPRLADGGSKVTFVTHSRLFALLGSLDGRIDLLPMEAPGRVEGVDAWAPLLSIPGALGLDGGRLASSRPYLTAQPERIERWRAVLPKGFRIGIAWQGNPAAPVDRGRSAPLAAFAPLAALPGVCLVSLQVGHGREQADEVAFRRRIFRFGADFDAGPDAFLDTAAVLMSLDLVVSVDTAVAHLAGALGVPAAILLRTPNADWRWLDRADNTVWYPTARLYRQSVPGDWWDCVCRVARDVSTGWSAAGALVPQAPLSVGELFDKISILRIKRERIQDATKRANVADELRRLDALALTLRLGHEAVEPARTALARVNAELWTIEDEVRRCEAAGDFGPRFIALARSVYITNDRRAALKAEINELSGSVLREEKSYA